MHGRRQACLTPEKIGSIVIEESDNSQSQRESCADVYVKLLSTSIHSKDSTHKKFKHPMNQLRHPQLALFTTLLLGAGSFFATAASPAESTEKQANLNGGYHLLHKLSGDESQLPMLLLVKHAPPELATFADEISKVGKETMAALDRFQDQDPAIHFDRNPLPSIEQDVRDSIKGDKQHQLLFGTSDSEFVRALVVSQIEASTYGLNLCKTLADQEDDPARIKTLRRLSDKWLEVRRKAFQILRNY